MADYMEYIKGGDILIAPSLDYKHQYILKCGLCKQYYGDFELFFNHYLSHYDMESNEEETVSESEIIGQQEFCDDPLVEGDDDGIENAMNEDVASISEHMYDSEGEITISSVEEEIEADEEAELKLDPNYTDDSNNSDNETLEIEVPTENSTAELVDETNKEEKSIEEDFVKQYLKSKENVVAFIAAYKKQVYLWDYNHPMEYRKTPLRDIAWKEIATELYKTNNIQILSHQVAAITLHIRQKYREKELNAENSKKPNNDIMPFWIFEELSFLKPFVQKEPIAILDPYLDLSPEQTIQILGIFERCPHLWDSNTIENYCTNKRNEAITHMKSIITEELDLDVDECTLKRYVQTLQDFFIVQKRHHRGYVKGKRVKSKYYQHMNFLFDHMPPFRCSHCRQTLFSPLQFKVHTSQHDGTIPLNCYSCNKDFKIVETYIYHIRRHMDDLDKECKECGRKFMRTNELICHMRSHTGDKPYFCDVCGSSFRHRTSFNLHKKRHAKKYGIFCPYCSKGFYTKANLDIHMTSHNDERNFACRMCGKTFKTKKTLKNHEYTHEEGLNHECDLCGKLFKNKINLAHHKRTHGNNKKDLKTK